MSHYQPYPAYKDSGVEWLGAVPEHWVSKKILYWISGYGSGTTPSRDDEYSVDGLPWVTTGELRENIVFETEKYVTQEAISKNSALKIQPAGALVIAMYGATVGRLGVLGVDATLNQACFAIHPNDKVRISFLRNWFEGFRGELVALATGAGQPNISGDKIRNLTLPCPQNFSEQDAIITHLDRETTRIDALISKKTRFIELLREKRQALVTHAVTKGLDPNVMMKDSGVAWLGEMPEHWQVKRLKFLANVQTGVAKGKDNAGKDTIEVPYLRVANVQDGYLSLDDVTTIKIPLVDLPRYTLQHGDVLMNEGGDFDKLGRGHVWQGEIELCIHQNHVFAVRPTKVNSEWLNTFTGSGFGQFYFMTRSKQSTNLASISSTNIMELPVVMPPDSEQVQILEYLDRETARIDTLISKTERSIELLKERRSALISAAVTGQIDLRELA